MLARQQGYQLVVEVVTLVAHWHQIYITLMVNLLAFTLYRLLQQPQTTIIVLGQQPAGFSMDDVIDQLEVEINEGSREIMSTDSRQVQNIIEVAKA